MNNSSEDAQALATATALRDLGREERELIEQGRLEDLGARAARRAELLRELDRELKPGWPAEPTVHAMLELVRAEGAQNLALLLAIHQRRRAQGATAGSSRRALSGQRQ